MLTLTVWATKLDKMARRGVKVAAACRMCDWINVLHYKEIWTIEPGMIAANPARLESMAHG